MKRFLLFLIGLYRRVYSAYRPPACRFYPTCSAYAEEAITVHGSLRGSLFALRRILKCHPYHPGGVDKVPPKVSRS